MTLLGIASSVAEVGLVAAAFYKFFAFVTTRVLSEENADKWRVKRKVRLDIACKFVSSCFAMLATAAGLALMTTGERKNTNVEHIMLVASGYFIYDVFAMFR